MNSKAIEKLYNLKEQGIQHLKAGHYMHSSVYFKDILQKFDYSLDSIETEDDMQKVIRQLKLSSHKNLALCFLKLGKYQLSIKECQTVLDIEPHNVKILYRIGWAYIYLKQFQQAQKYLKRGFLLDPKEVEIMKGLEEIERQKQHRDEVDKPTEKGLFVRFIVFMLELIFWFPLLIYRKAKSLAQSILTQQKKQT